jgi:hypothetical protein
MILTTVATLVASAATLVATAITGIFGLKIVRLQLIAGAKSQSIEWLSQASHEQYRTKRDEIKRACHLAWQLWDELSLTNSAIDRSEYISEQVLDRAFQARRKKVTEILMIAGIHIPEVTEDLKILAGFMSSYWGHATIVHQCRISGESDCDMAKEASKDLLVVSQKACAKAHKIAMRLSEEVKAMKPPIYLDKSQSIWVRK